MTVFEAVVLGLVQGLTEFLPVSSSGHLIVFPELLGWDVSSVTFDVAIHVATLGAIFVALREDIVRLVKGIFVGDKGQQLLALKVVAATLPAVFVGYFFNDVLERFRVMAVVGFSLILWGVILLLAEKYSERLRTQAKNPADMLWGQALLVGAMQVLAFIPGTSRSGVTMSAGLFSGLSRSAAARFSFLLAIPALTGAGTLTAIDVVEHGLDVSPEALIVGSFSAFISGIFAIQFLLAIIKKWSFAPFALYRVVFGAILLIISVLKY